MDSTVTQDRGQLRRAVIASTVGTSIEWYDFFLYGTAAALVFPKLFFPKHDPLSGLLIAFATQAVGFAARPVGAAIFGHFGDRIGRKGTLIATLLLMGLATALIGVLPSYATIGIWGGVLLTLLRVCQGLGVGGEWGGSVLLSMEWGSRRRKGFVASWPQVGVPIGLILGNGANLIFSSTMGPAYLAWGWRIPFLLSLVLVGIGLWIRLGILETPLFQRLLDSNKIETQPVLEVIRRNPGEIILSALLRMPEQAPFYIFTAFVLAYGKNVLKLSTSTLLATVLVAAAVSLLTIPLSGHLSDLIGRKKMYMLGIIAVGVYAIPYFLLLNTKSLGLVFLGVIISLIPHDMQYGPQASLIAETFTGRLRYSGASLGYQLASIVAGGPAPLIATALLAAYKTWVPIAIYIILNAVVGLIALALLPSRQAADHMVEYDTEGERAAEAARRPSPA